VRDAAGVATVVPGWPEAFRGSLAVAAGLTTWGRLRGPRFRRLFPDVYCPVGDEPPDLRLRSLGAYRLVEGRGVLSGYSAAVLLDAGCAPHPDVPAEVTVAGGGQRVHRGLRVHRDRIAAGEPIQVGDVRCTSSLRTAYDLGRQDDLVEAVVAVDRLANRHRFPPDLLLHVATHYRAGPGTARLCRTLAHTNPYSGSPMETRLRMIVVRAGLPRPCVQWVVQDVAARTAVWLDLAWPEHRVGVEYEGGGHTAPVEVLRDAGRYTRLVDRGWRIYRYTKHDVYGDPGRIIAELTRALGS
jgi:hypothetical protein